MAEGEDVYGMGSSGGLGSIVDEVSDLALDYPDLARGIEATLRTLVICRYTASPSMQQSIHANPASRMSELSAYECMHAYECI